MATIAALGAGCEAGKCPQLNTSYQLNWTSGCNWITDEIVIGNCSGCGDSVKATMTVTTVVFPTPGCQISVAISQDIADDSCNRYSALYRATFTAATDPMAPLVLSFISAGFGICTGWPPTITLNAC